MITLDQRCSKPGLKEHWYKKYKARHALQTLGIVDLVLDFGLMNWAAVQPLFNHVDVNNDPLVELKQLTFVTQGVVQPGQNGAQFGVVARS
jgi:hypothetical protein